MNLRTIGRGLVALAIRPFRAKPRPPMTAQQAAFSAAFAADFERRRPGLLAKTEEPPPGKAAVYTFRLRGFALAMLLAPSLALAQGAA